MKIKIIQIFHDHKQRGQIVFTPYFNPPPAVNRGDYHQRYIFLESEVMVRSHEVKSYHHYDYFGVLSPNFQKKIDGSRFWGELKNTGPQWNPYSWERYIEKSNGAPIISFCAHRPHSVFKTAERYHPGIKAMTKSILDEIGYHIDLDDIQQQPIYFNYFLAQTPVFNHFCETLMKPFIKAAVKRPELWENSKYPKKFPEPLQKAYGISHWPFHPFIAERMISLYIHKEKLKIATP